MKILRNTLLLGLLALMPVGVEAQTAYKGQLYVNKEQFTVDGSLLRVKMRVNYDRDVLKNGQTLTLTPVIKDDRNIRKLEPVVVESRERGSADSRKAYFDKRSQKNRAIVQRDKNNGTRYFLYEGTLPYESWMEDAAFYIQSEEKGWHKAPIVFEDKVFSRVDLHTLPVNSSDPTVSTMNAMDLKSGVKTEWIQFLNPSAGRDEGFSMVGSLPLADSQAIGNLSERKFNATVYEAITEAITPTLQVPGTTLKALNIVGYGAPTGNYKSNEAESAARALSLKKYLMDNRTTSADGLTVTWVPEDWDSIYALVNSSDMKLKTAALDIIKTVDVTQGREDELKMLGGGSAYSFMKQYIFPRVQRIKYTALFNRHGSGVASNQLQLNGSNHYLSAGDMYFTACNFAVGSREFNDMIDLSARLYPDNAESNINAAGVAMLRGQTEQAEKYLGKWLTDPRAFNNLGVLYMLKGDYSKAEVYLKMAQSQGVEQATRVLTYMSNMK